MSSNREICKPEFPKPYLDSLFNKAFERYIFHLNKSERYWKIFGFLSLVLAISIPFLSASLTVFIGADILGKGNLIIIGFVLTLLSSIVGIFNPNEQYISYAEELIQLHDWAVNLEAKLGSVKEPTEEKYHDILLKMNSELTKIGKKRARSTVPKITQ